jgi:hypothetical protein
LARKSVVIHILGNASEGYPKIDSVHSIFPVIVSSNGIDGFPSPLLLRHSPRKLPNENPMGSQVYRENYLAALEVANSDLDQIFQESEMLQLQKERLEVVMRALEPFLRSGKSFAESIPAEPARAVQMRVEPEPEVTKPVFRAVQAPEAVVPAAFSPVPDAILDPLQNRINRALGLAVA